MDARALDVLHDAGDEHALAVGDGVDLDLLALEVLVDKDRLAAAQLDGGAHEAHQLRRVLHDLHRAPAEDVAGPHEHRIADDVGGVERVFERRDAGARRLRDAEAR